MEKFSHVASTRTPHSEQIVQSERYISNSLSTSCVALSKQANNNNKTMKQMIKKKNNYFEHE